MKKYFLVLLSLLISANISAAEFSMPKINFAKKSDTIQKTSAQKIENNKLAEKSNKESEQKASKPLFNKSEKVEKKTEAPKSVQNKEQKAGKPLFNKSEKVEKKTETPKPVQNKEQKAGKPLFNKSEKVEKKIETPKPVQTDNDVKPFIHLKKNETEKIKPSETPQLSNEPNTNKIEMKNPLRKLKKTKPDVGEDMVSKEQVKEELERVQNLSQKAIALYTDNNLDESLNTFLRIPEKYRTAQDNLLIGNILLDLDKPEDAVFMYKRAILADEFYYKPYYNIGNICLNDDKYFMAIDYYKKAVKYAPEFPYAYYNLACAYIKAGELRKAKSNLTKAIELRNTEPDFHYNLAYVYKKLNKPKQAQIYLDNYNKLTNGQ